MPLISRVSESLLAGQLVPGGIKPGDYPRRGGRERGPDRRRELPTAAPILGGILGPLLLGKMLCWKLLGQGAHGTVHPCPAQSGGNQRNPLAAAGPG